MIFVVFISIIFLCILVIINKKVEKKDVNVVRFSRFFLALGVFVLLVLVVGNIYLYLIYEDSNSNVVFRAEDVPAMVILNIFILIPVVYLLMLYFNYRIKFDEHRLIVKNIFGKKEYYSYDDIKWYSYTSGYLGQNGIPLNKGESEKKNFLKLSKSLHFNNLELCIGGRVMHFALAIGMPTLIKYIKEHKDKI